jgi:hypothetical protein
MRGTSSRGRRRQARGATLPSHGAMGLYRVGGSGPVKRSPPRPRRLTNRPQPPWPRARRSEQPTTWRSSNGSKRSHLLCPRPRTVRPNAPRLPAGLEGHDVKAPVGSASGAGSPKGTANRDSAGSEGRRATALEALVDEPLTSISARIGHRIDCSRIPSSGWTRVTAEGGFAPLAGRNRCRRPVRALFQNAMRFPRSGSRHRCVAGRG